MLRKYTLYLAGALGLILGSVGCGDSHPRAGAFDVAWNIDSQTYGGTTCERAGISMVVLSVAHVRTNEPYFTYFNCVDRGGISDAIPVGDYWVTLYAYRDPPNNDGSNYVTYNSLPVSYHIDPDYVTQLPEVSLVVP